MTRKDLFAVDGLEMATLRKGPRKSSRGERGEREAVEEGGRKIWEGKWNGGRKRRGRRVVGNGGDGGTVGNGGDGGWPAVINGAAVLIIFTCADGASSDKDSVTHVEHGTGCAAACGGGCGG
uniref:Uncharacterized protein n=1 Tax=Chenopodium quinoa TaxID=63459 RepID=A0A803MYI9_CHEQI